MSDLLERLRDMAAGKHDDLGVAAEAIEDIIDLNWRVVQLEEERDPHRSDQWDVSRGTSGLEPLTRRTTRMTTDDPTLATEFDAVHRPSHYAARDEGGIECIDAMLAAYGREKVEIWATLNAFTYLWRCFDKHPTPTEDRGKAVWNLRFANNDDPRNDRADA